jgi:phosphohistidine phosphatase
MSPSRKELLILRHAKSSWSNPDLTDHQRPLNDRGRSDAPRMAALIEREDLVPDLILTSSAVRALSTAELIRENIDTPVEMQIIDQLYSATPRVYVEQLRLVPDRYQRIMVVGHNPCLEELVYELAGEWQEIPTAAIAYFVLGVSDWAELKLNSKKHRLQNVWRPKDMD